MGVVYLAKDARLDREVALKLPMLWGDEDPEFLHRFYREARAAAGLRHPNICRVYDVGEHNGQPYLTMEYLEGVLLSDHLKKRSSPMELREAIRLVRKLAQVMRAAHQEGIVHRDLKPTNIMLDLKAGPIVMDFGLARREDREESVRTRAGQQLGSPAYMPLEQFQGNVEKIGPRSDIYSLGVILFELLTGRRPYEGNAFEVHIKILRSDTPAPSSLRPELDPELDAICRKAMAKEPEDRFGTMKELAGALTDYLQSSGGKPGPKVAGTLEPESVSDERTALLEPEPSMVNPKDGWPGHQDVSGRARTQRATNNLLILSRLGGLLAMLLLGYFVFDLTNYGWVRIKLLPVSASVDVLLDGKPVDLTLLAESMLLRAGERHLRVTGDGYQLWRGTFLVERGGNNDAVRVELTRLPTIPNLGPLNSDPPRKPETADSSSKMAKTVTNSIGMNLVLIPAGAFMMGSPDSERDRWDDEKPLHCVRITRSFYLGETEVTVGQFRRFVEATAYLTDAEQSGRGSLGFHKNTGGWSVDSSYTWRFKGFEQTDEHPVVNVSWNDAREFCAWLSRKEGQTYRLPTEAEWEYACRGGTTTRYWSGDDPETLAAVGNVPDRTAADKIHLGGSIQARDGYVFTAPVRRFEPNAFGLFDMHGNVWEWCGDWHNWHYYKQSPVDDPLGPAQGESRVCRGGGWARSPDWCRSARRFTADVSPGQCDDHGFRVALSHSGG
jgi:formylglycine-generating enzyme required for sulfatase activity